MLSALKHFCLSGIWFRNCFTDLYQIFRDDRRLRREAFDKVSRPDCAFFVFALSALKRVCLSGLWFRNCLTDLYHSFREDRRLRREAFDKV